MMNGAAAFRRLACLKNHLLLSKRVVHVSSIREENKGGRWVQPAGAGAKRMEYAHRLGVLHFPVSMTINTSEPLKTEDLEKSLVHLYNKILTLRTCYRNRGDELWIWEMEDEKIDFLEVNGSDYFEELNALMSCAFTNNEEGPLWRVRLMRECSIAPKDEAPPGLPHQSTILISMHHGITDGSACFYIFVTLLNILEQVIDGTFVDDGEQLGVIAGDQQTLSLKNDIRKHFEEHPKEVEEFARKHLQSEFTPLLYKAFGYPKDPNATTRFLVSRLETSTLRKFLEKCRVSGVTFNSGFVLAINTALVELAREAGVSQDSFYICSKHTVNLRRYWEKHKNFSFGCHIGRMQQKTDTFPYDKDTFWNHARKLDSQLREKVMTKHVLKDEVVREMKNIVESPLRRDVDQPVPIDCDYSFSNAFLPSDFDPWRDNKHVKGSQILSFIQMELTQNMTFHIISSDPRYMSYTINYSTWHITDENALKFMNKVEYIVEDLIS